MFRWYRSLHLDLESAAEYLLNKLNAIVNWEAREWNKLTRLEIPSGSNFENNQILRIPRSTSVWLQTVSSASRLGLKQGSLGKCRNADIIDTHVIDTALVYSPVRNVYATSIVFVSLTKFITESPWKQITMLKPAS